MTSGFRFQDHPVTMLRPHVTHPYAWVGHIPFMYLIADLLRPRRFVELGTDSGNSYLAFCQAVVKLGIDTECFAVDSWQGDEHARHYGDHVYRTLRSYHDARYASFSKLVKAFFDDALTQFEDGSVDLLHIDGLHTYEAVKHDFETWLPKLSDSAVVLFHDSAVNERGFGVQRFLDELRATYEVFEFTHSNGLGVVQVGARPAQAFRDFMEEARTRPESTRAFFESVATTLIDPTSGELAGGVEAVERQVDCVLYYRSQDEGFDEARSLVMLHTGGVDARFVFDMPDRIRPDFVRVDPAAVPGVFRLVSVGVSTGRESVEMLAEARSGRFRVNGDVLDAQGVDGIRWLALHDDPHVEIDLRSLWSRIESGDGASVEVAVAYEQVLTEPGVQALALEAGNALVQARRSHRLENGVEAADRVAALVSANQVTLQAQGDRLGSMIEQLRDVVIERDREMSTLRTELDMAAYWREEAERERERLKRSVEDVEQRLMTLGGEFVELETQSREQIASTNRRPDEKAARRLASVAQGFDTAVRDALAWHDRTRDDLTLSMPLLPLANLEYDATSGSWIAATSDPQFEIASLNALAGRWVLVQTKIEPATFWTSVPTLYFDQGAGCSEADSIELPIPSTAGDDIRYVVLIPRGTVAVRFDPMSQAGHFRIDGLQVTPLSRPRAARMMLGELVRREGRRSLLKWMLHQVRPVPTPARLRQLARALPFRYWSFGRTAQSSYAQWIRSFEPGEGQYAALADSHSRWPLRPLISIVMPVYNTDRRILEAAIESVRRQVYTHFELCIADDASPAPHVREVLARYSALDPRISVTYRKENGHIVQASNSALDLAHGDFVALLDHDDLLHPLALHYIVDAINRHPDAGILYSDEDKIDERGLRYGPYFKPAFNYELLLSQNMISHLGVYRRSLVEDVGRFRDSYKGSQDYDLALRVLEKIEPRQVIHVPRVLYHWRAIPGSTAVGAAEKPYAQVAAHAAIQNHLERTGLAGQVLAVEEAPQFSRVRFDLPELAPHVTIIVPTRDRVDLLSMCIDSIIEHTRYPSYDIVIVDNGSVETATSNYLDRLPRDRVTVIRDDGPFNYSAINNRAASVARGPLLCLLNNDIEVRQPEWLDELARQAWRQDVGCVGARLWYPDERLQHGGVLLGIRGIASHSHKFATRGAPGYFGRAVLHQQLSAVTAACLMIRKSIYQEVGGLDEKLAVAFNDIDFCLRVAEAGYRNVWTPFAELVHHESASRGLETSPEKIARFQGEIDFMYARWRSALMTDPAYSPNLTFDDESFDMAWPPRDLSPTPGGVAPTREQA